MTESPYMIVGDKGIPATAWGVSGDYLYGRIEMPHAYLTPEELDSLLVALRNKIHPLFAWTVENGPCIKLTGELKIRGGRSDEHVLAGWPGCGRAGPVERVERKS